MKTRLDRHYEDKDFWQQAIVFTTKGTPLNKAEVKYLEASLLKLARRYGRSKLQNTNKPRLPGLSEADQAEMEGYLDELLSLLPVLGVPFFEREEAPSKDREVYHVDRSGCKAAGFETNMGFTVREGSLARESTVPSMKEKASGYYLQRQELIKEGVLEKKTNHYRFTRDWPFSSPSAAAAVCLGSNANGLIEWKDESGTTLKANRKEGDCLDTMAGSQPGGRPRNGRRISTLLGCEVRGRRSRPLPVHRGTRGRPGSIRAVARAPKCRRVRRSHTRT